jgi:hypothetical protein
MTTMTPVPPTTSPRITALAVALLTTGLLSGVPVGARQASPPTLTATLSDTRLSAGETLSARVTVTNTGFGAIADFYFVILLPDGSTVVSAGPGVGARFGRFSDLRTLVPVAGGIGLGAPFAYQNDAFFEYTFTGSEPPGIYRVYFAALSAGALGDGTIGGGELIALATTEFTVAPALTTVPDPSRTSTATISTTGGQVATTASNGLAYSLAFPAGAVAAATTVSITPLVSAANVPGVGSFALGLRAEPSGLTFSTPATLSIALPTGMAVSPGGYAALISSDQGRRLEVVPIALADRTLTVRVPHFSDVVVTSNFLGICGIPNQSAEMIEACRQLAAALDLAGGDVEDPNFKEWAVMMALTPWYETGLRSRLARLVDDEPPAGQNKDAYLDAVTQEWTAWAAAYSVVAGPIRVNDTSRRLAEIIRAAHTRMAFGTKFGQDRANERCLADKPFARVHVQRVSALDFLFQSTFDEPNPFPTEYCLDLTIEGGPLPVLTPGVRATMPVSVQARFSDGGTLPPPAEAVVTITATQATVETAGGVWPLPANRTVAVMPSSTSSTVIISGALLGEGLDRLPVRRRTFEAGNTPNLNVTSSLLASRILTNLPGWTTTWDSARVLRTYEPTQSAEVVHETEVQVPSGRYRVHSRAVSSRSVTTSTEGTVISGSGTLSPGLTINLSGVTPRPTANTSTRREQNLCFDLNGRYEADYSIAASASGPSAVLRLDNLVIDAPASGTVTFESGNHCVGTGGYFWTCDYRGEASGQAVCSVPVPLTWAYSVRLRRVQ